jgi:hypothetical protein
MILSHYLSVSTKVLLLIVNELGQRLKTTCFHIEHSSALHMLFTMTVLLEDIQSQ